MLVKIPYEAGSTFESGLITCSTIPQTILSANIWWTQIRLIITFSTIRWVMTHYASHRTRLTHSSVTHVLCQPTDSNTCSICMFGEISFTRDTVTCISAYSTSKGTFRACVGLVIGICWVWAGLIAFEVLWIVIELFPWLLKGEALSADRWVWSAAILAVWPTKAWDWKGLCGGELICREE